MKPDIKIRSVYRIAGKIYGWDKKYGLKGVGINIEKLDFYHSLFLYIQIEKKMYKLTRYAYQEFEKEYPKSKEIFQGYGKNIILSVIPISIMRLVYPEMEQLKLFKATEKKFF